MSLKELAGGRYTLDRHLATGGMGTVYVATDTALSRTVAIKILKPEYASDATFRTRFEIEARHAAGLDHPGIAKVYDYGEVDSDGPPRPFLVMEYVDGQPLSALLAPGRPLEPKRVVELIAQVADALQAAHDKQIVHRDVKPANLLITPDARVKVTDFGIAKAASDTPITQTGTIIGTAHYLPPEQAEGKPATARSDIYALGVVLYECLSGTRPFVGDNPVAIAIAHVRQQPPPLPDSIEPWLQALTMRMLAKNPEDRPASAGELARELRAGAAGAEVGGGGPRTSLLDTEATLALTDDANRTQVMPAEPDSTPDTAPQPAAPMPDDERRRRRRIAAAIVGAVLLLALLIIGAVALFGDDDDPESPQEPTPTDTNDRPNRNQNQGDDPTETEGEEPPPETQPTDDQPTGQPTDDQPTGQPTDDQPTGQPTDDQPTDQPTDDQPTDQPTSEATSEPTTQPTTPSRTTPTTESATTPRPDESTANPDEEDATTP